MKFRALHSFLISLNAHVWGLVLLSLVFVHRQKPPEPQRIEVQFLKLPAPLEGGSSDSREAARLETMTAASPSQATERVNRPRARVREQRGPRVEYRVRVAKTTAPVTVRESGTWVPTSSIRLRESALHDSGSRIAGVTPDARPTASDAGAMSGGRWPQNLVEDQGGDTRELIKIIQARIDAVTPLVHASAGPCQTTSGVVHLRFIVNRAGYPCGFRIISGSGVRCLDDEVDNVLHMAEPYPFVAGWIPVTVRFAPRTSI
jgi:outer membrane biosynthesis protein TonB